MKLILIKKFLENIIQFVFIVNLICLSQTKANDETNIETINVELNDGNPIQYIQSPGFPTKHYPKNYRVNYDLKVNLSDRLEGLASRIGIRLEYIAIEPSVDCENTNLKVIFPKGEIRTFCGLHAGKTMILASDSAKIQFRGNALEQDRGFKIRTQVIRSDCSHKYVNIKEGVISSPNYPNNYTDDKTCVWEVEAPEGKFVKLVFEDTFDINTSNNICAEDYLQVSRSGDLETDVQRFCGNERPEEIVSHSNKILIKFNTDCCNNGKGFKIRFVEHDRPEAAAEILPMLTPDGCPCGKENLRLVKRIVGGTEVSPAHRYPWMAVITTSTGSPFCGGALINDRYIITASHCVVNESPSTIGVRLGQHSLQESTPILKVSQIISHINYDSVSQSNDIALIRLSAPVQFTTNISPVCLPPSDLLEPDDLLVAGWGRVEQGGRTSDRLLEISLPEYPWAKCEAKYSGMITDKQMCAGGIEGQDACQGDSGGPLTSHLNGKVNIVGVVSWGIGCAKKDYPGVYSRITSYLKWIADNTRDAKYCLSANQTSTQSNQLVDSRPIQPNFDNCGQPNLKLSKRVVGGSETVPQEFPWIVVIAFNGQLIGSGSLIAPNVVLTSAQRLKSIYNTNSAPDIRVIVGAHDITRSEATKRTYGVNQIVFHPRFGINTPVDYDFALIELKATAEGFLSAHRPVCLPRTDTPYVTRSPVLSAGWGRTSTYSSGSSVLRKVNLNLFDRQVCTNTYSNAVTNAMICAYNDNKDMCLGDIGGPLMQYSEGRMYLLGIYSWQSSQGCATGKPSVFGDVRYALQWIRDVTNGAINTA